MMKNIIDLIKEKIRNHKKLSIIALLLFLLIGGTVGYVLLTNNETNNNPKVTQTNSQNKNPDTNVTGSNNAKKKEDKKSDDKKQDDKKSDEKKEEVTSETKTEETTTSISNNTSATENNNVSNSTTNNAVPSQPTSIPCVPTYTTVNHPEQGHYEQTLVMPAYDEPVYENRIVGNQSGTVYNSIEEFDAQLNSGSPRDTGWHSGTVQVNTIHHDAEYNQVWVVDQQAWTETVASGC